MNKKLDKPWESKSPGMQKALGGLFPEQQKNIKAGKCVFCGSKKLEHEDFEDNLSRREFGISGMCQACQNKMWKPE